ncbi:hypothetical protein TOPH_07481, partial [Tolypocladium ophioglossoides CBS 100239]
WRGGLKFEKDPSWARGGASGGAASGLLVQGVVQLVQGGNPGGPRRHTRSAGVRQLDLKVEWACSFSTNSATTVQHEGDNGFLHFASRYGLQVRPQLPARPHRAAAARGQPAAGRQHYLDSCQDEGEQILPLGCSYQASPNGAVISCDKRKKDLSRGHAVIL